MRGFILIPTVLLYMPIGFAALLNDGGPNDYFDPTPRSQEVVGMVERLHLDRAIAQMKKGRTDFYVWEDLDFTLRWFPNHPQGLQVMTDYLLKYKGAPPGKQTPEYYFDAALKYRPNDFTTNILYGMHLHKIGELDKALVLYQKAEILQPNSADLQYNLGLLFIDKKDYTSAKKHADKAYQLGHPLPGLRNKLKKIGAWKRKAE